MFEKKPVEMSFDGLSSNDQLKIINEYKHAVEQEIYNDLNISALFAEEEPPQNLLAFLPSILSGACLLILVIMLFR